MKLTKMSWATVMSLALGKYWGGVPELNIAMVLSVNWTRTVKLNATVILRVSVKRS